MAEEQKETEQKQDKPNDALTRNIGEIALIAGAKFAPQYFMPLLQQQYPGLFAIMGSGSRINYFNRDREIRMQQSGLRTASQIDQENAAETLAGIELAAKRLSGAEITAEDEALARNRGEYAAQTLPATFAMMQMLGISEEQIAEIKQAMYGQKGSISDMYSKGYDAFRPFMSSGRAVDQMERLVTGQFGTEYDRERMGGLTATDMGDVLQYMSGFGGLNASSFNKGSGLGLSRMGEDTRSAVQMGLPIDEIWDQQAVDQASAAYYNDVKADPSEVSQLKQFMSEDQSKAFSIVEEMDTTVGELNAAGYGVNIDTTIKDKNEALKQLNAQFDEQMKKAKEAKDEEAVKQLEDAKDKLVKQAEEFYKESNEADENGTKQTYQEIHANRDKIIAETSKNAIEATVLELQQDIADIEDAKQDAVRIYDPEARRMALDEVADMEDELRAKQESSALYKQAGRVVDTTGTVDKAIAVGEIGQSVRDAFAANGKQVTTAQALEASKGLIGDSLYGKDLDKLSKEVSVTMQNAIEGGRSTQDLLFNAFSFNDVAKQLGIGNTTRAAMINMSGERNYNTYIQQGMTAKEAADQVKKDKIAMAKESKTANGRALQAMNGILGEMTDERFDALMESEELTEEDAELIRKIKTHQDLTQEEMQRVSKVSRKALGVIGYDSRAASEALRNKDNIDRGADEYTTRQLEAKRVMRKQRKLSQGLAPILGDSVKDSDTRETIESVMAEDAVGYKEAALKTDEEGAAARVKALQETARKLADRGADEAATKIQEAIDSGDQAQINTIFDKLNKNMERMGDRRATSGQEQVLRNKKEEYNRGEANRNLSIMVGNANSTGLAGIFDKIKSGDDINDIMDIYKAATGFDTIQEQDKPLVARAMVVNGALEAGKFVNANGEEDLLTNDDIDIAKQAASRSKEWENLTEDEAATMDSGITTKGGRHLTVAQAREVAQKAYEAASSKLPGGATEADKETGFTNYVTEDEAFMAEMEEEDAYMGRLYNRAMEKADKLEKEGKADEAEAIRKRADSGDFSDVQGKVVERPNKIGHLIHKIVARENAGIGVSSGSVIAAHELEALDKDTREGYDSMVSEGLIDPGKFSYDEFLQQRYEKNTNEEHKQAYKAVIDYRAAKKEETKKDAEAMADRAEENITQMEKYKEDSKYDPGALKSIEAIEKSERYKGTKEAYDLYRAGKLTKEEFGEIASHYDKGEKLDKESSRKLSEAYGDLGAEGLDRLERLEKSIFLSSDDKKRIEEFKKTDEYKKEKEAYDAYRAGKITKEEFGKIVKTNADKVKQKDEYESEADSAIKSIDELEKRKESIFISSDDKKEIEKTEKSDEYKKQKKAYDLYKENRITKEEFGKIVKTNEEGIEEGHGINKDELEALDEKLTSSSKISEKELEAIRKILEKLVS